MHSFRIVRVILIFQLISLLGSSIPSQRWIPFLEIAGWGRWFSGSAERVGSPFHLALGILCSYCVFFIVFFRGEVNWICFFYFFFRKRCGSDVWVYCCCIGFFSGVRELDLLYCCIFIVFLFGNTITGPVRTCWCRSWWCLTSMVCMMCWIWFGCLGWNFFACSLRMFDLEVLCVLFYTGKYVSNYVHIRCICLAMFTTAYTY